MRKISPKSSVSKSGIDRIRRVNLIPIPFKKVVATRFFRFPGFLCKVGADMSGIDNTEMIILVTLRILIFRHLELLF